MDEPPRITEGPLLRAGPEIPRLEGSAGVE